MPVVIPPSSGATSALQVVPTQQLFDYVYDAQGNPLKGLAVPITLSAGNATSITPQVELSGLIVPAVTDANGFWSANLIPNANINPANTVYTVQPAGLAAYEVSIPSAGGPFQSTNPSVLVGTPGVLAPATTGITGNLTVSGNETVTGTLSVAGTSTLATTTTGDLTILSAFRLLFGAAASKIIPGATSLSLRNHADSTDNLLVTDAGAVTTRAGLTVVSGGLTVTAGDATLTAGRLLLNAAAAKIKGGATSLSLRNNADSADNVLVADAGNVTVRGTVTSSTTPFHAEAFRNAALSIANGFVFVLVPFDALDASGDPNSNFNTGTGVYTCPVAGLYRVSAAVIFNAGVGTTAMTISKNGATDSRRIGTSYNGTSNPAVNGSGKIRCAANDTLAVQVAQSTATNPAPLFVGAAICWAQFEFTGP